MQDVKNLLQYGKDKGYPVEDRYFDRVWNFWRQTSNEDRYAMGTELFTLYASFPVLLTPDLLHKFRFNFKNFKVSGQIRVINPIAVSDLLLSGICREVNRGLYEIPDSIRFFLLNILKDLDKDTNLAANFGLELQKDLVAHIAAFTRYYATYSIQSPSPYEQATFKAIQINADLYLNPAQALHQIAQDFANIHTTGALQRQLAIVTEHILSKLYVTHAADKQQMNKSSQEQLRFLLTYTQALRKFYVEGNTDDFKKLIEEHKVIPDKKVDPVLLPVPFNQSDWDDKLPDTGDLALMLIKENKAKRERGEDASYLDLGCCGLTKMLDISDMDWLETLVLSDWWVEFNEGKNQWIWFNSQNNGMRNQIKDIPPNSFHLPFLKKLIINNLGISNPLFLKNLPSLIYLDLSSNQINDGQPLETLTNLTSLNLNGNKINDGYFLHRLTSLTHLDLGNNNITDCGFLGEMIGLTSLHLTGNQINNGLFLEKLVGLISLKLGHNEITDGYFLKKLTNLTFLDLSYNKIKDWRFLEKLTRLISLNLSYNKISDFSFLENLTGLTTLDLSHNQISDGRFLRKLTGLTTLDLSSNQISDGRFLEKLTSLAVLNLRANQISDGRFLDNLASLTTLDLSSNQISDGRFLEKLAGLIKIDLSENRIEDLTPLLYFIREKRMEVVSKERHETREGEINIKGNPLINPPLEIVEQGTRAIVGYFEELQKTVLGNLFPLNEAKLIIVGEPRAGKTTLRYKLCDTEREMAQQEDSTKGLDIELQYFAYTDEAGASQTFQYHIWDFGGQHIYHATHRFFLTKRAVYVVVVDTDVNDKQNNLDYWLHMIELMGDGSPVLLVQNQKNDRSIEISDALRNRFRNILVAKDYELNLARLQQQKNPKFDAQRLADFQRFKKDIQRIFEQQAPILMTRPKNDTRRALERVGREKPVLELAEYRAVCAENGLQDPLAQTDLLRTLHNLGICLWYEAYDFLERIVILQNRWATDAVFKVLDNETVKKDKGHFRRKQLNQIWVAEEYQGRVSELVELMKQFKLCYQIAQTDAFIVPQLLDKNPPAGFSRDNVQQGGVRMVIEYEFMPRGIMTQFIVAMHRQISGGQRHAWETGFAIQSQQGPPASGMAEESYDRKLELWAKGPGAGLLLQQMLGELDKIHDSFNRLRYTKRIPCNCTRCAAPGATRIKEFDYEEILIEMYESRQPGIRCSYGNQTVSFEQLLGRVGFTAQQTERDFWGGERGIDNHIDIHLNVHDIEEKNRQGGIYNVKRLFELFFRRKKE